MKLKTEPFIRRIHEYQTILNPPTVSNMILQSALKKIEDRVQRKIRHVELWKFCFLLLSKCVGVLPLLDILLVPVLFTCI